MVMDDIDKQILNLIQNDFPLEAEPFKRIGREMGISEDEALSRVKELKERGIIRRIGALFDSAKFGFSSTLCAARVPEGRIEQFVSIVNSYPGVTHNYHRDHEYNIWFTLIAPTAEAIDRALGEISERTGIDDILNMPARRKFKVKATFDL